MLDENLPTFHFKPSSEHPYNTVLLFAQNGSDPSPSFLLRRPDPATPQAKNKYAVAIADCSFANVIYAESLIEPDWKQQSLTSSEARAQHGGPSPVTADVPDSFILQLYNPDQQVVVRWTPGGFTKTENWEFEMPERSFRVPSASRLDRESDDPPATDLVPKIVFRWKRDGRLSKDMTCYLVGKSVDGKKSKEPDITIAMLKHSKSSAAMALYEPNMRRVELEDLKGLEIILLLGADVIRELYLTSKDDPFNTSGAAIPTTAHRKRRSSRPTTSPPRHNNAPTMSGALNNAPPTSTTAHNARTQQEIDTETRRLRAMVEAEEREAKEREKRDLEEAKRIKRMLEEEEKQRQRREAEIEKETERLRKKYGVQNQSNNQSRPPLPPRPDYQQYPQQYPQYQQQLQVPGSASPMLPPRPMSAGPHNGSWQGQYAGPPQGQQGKKKDSGLVGAAASTVSGLWHRVEDERKKVKKERSVHF